MAGDGNVINQFQHPPTVKTTVARRPGSVTAEERQISQWIEDLAENTPRTTRQAAYAQWGSRLKAHFQMARRADILSSELADVEAWHRQQRGIQFSEGRTQAPDRWQVACVKTIKAATTRLGRTNGDYYPEVAARLKMKRPFTSLTQLTKADLDRVRQLARRDSVG